jgi:hypothetical protein
MKKECDMLKTFLATSALASLLALSAQAQDAPAAGVEESTPPAVGTDQDPAIQNDMGTDVLPQAADTPTAPEGGMAAEPVQPEGEMAAEPMEPAGEMAAEPPADPATDAATAPATMPEGWSQVDVATISADTLIGTEIQTYDQQQVAEVQDVLLDPNGQVENIVARFGGFLGFGETTVLLTMDEINVAQDADGRNFVMTDLTPDGLQGRPEYVAPEG